MDQITAGDGNNLVVAGPWSNSITLGDGSNTVCLGTNNSLESTNNVSIGGGDNILEVDALSTAAFWIDVGGGDDQVIVTDASGTTVSSPRPNDYRFDFASGGTLLYFSTATPEYSLLDSSFSSTQNTLSLDNGGFPGGSDILTVNGTLINNGYLADLLEYDGGTSVMNTNGVLAVNGTLTNNNYLRFATITVTGLLDNYGLAAVSATTTDDYGAVFYYENGVLNVEGTGQVINEAGGSARPLARLPACS